MIHVLPLRESQGEGKTSLMAPNGAAKNLSSAAPAALPPDAVIFGRSVTMQAIRLKATKVSCTIVPVLLQGERGSGKEVLAKWIHAHSPFASGRFVKVNCAAIPGTLLESELFGYEKGAFTGAHTAKPGRVEAAHRGTLFLDEIADLEMSLQAKLLQFLQDGRFTRIGDQQEQRVETRVICSTNRNLEQEVEARTFRSDLLYRINVIRIEVPRLRDRCEDIDALAEYFLAQFQGRFEKTAAPLSRGMLDYLQGQDWPGNIRELENRIARYVILGNDDDLEPERIPGRALPLVIEVGPDGSIPLKRIAKRAVREMERDVIFSVLRANHWNRRKAAEVLKISYRALISKIREAGLSGRRSALGRNADALGAGDDIPPLRVSSD